MKRSIGWLVLAALAAAVCATPALAQGAFSDVPTDHWAYAAVQALADAGYVIGYPDGTFGGKRALTRYEFALAVHRVVEALQAKVAQAGPPGPAGPAGAAGPPGPAGPGITPEREQLLQRLEREFAPELRMLRGDLDDLTGRVEELERKAAGPYGPKLAASGDISYRTGYYGTKIKTSGSGGSMPTGGGGAGQFLVRHGPVTGYGFNVPTADQAGLYRGLVESGAITVPQLLDGLYSLAVVGSVGTGLLAGGEGDLGLALLPVQISDTGKDADKAKDFTTIRMRLNLAGEVADGVNVNLTLIAEPDNSVPPSNVADPSAVTTRGLVSAVRLDEAWASFATKVAVPLDWTVGKQYFAFGQGLLVDNNILALDGLKAKAELGRRAAFTAIWGRTPAEAVGGQGWSPGPDFPPTTRFVGGQDDYIAGRLSVPVSDWELGANYLLTGFSDERGWSVDASGKILGAKVYGEFATLIHNADGQTVDDVNAGTFADNTAFVVGADLIDTDSVLLSGKWGKVEPGYAYDFVGNALGNAGFAVNSAGPGAFNLPFSALHPYTEYGTHYINWVDRPLFLDPTNVAEGFEVGLTLKRLLGAGTPLRIRYYDGDAIGGNANADRVWTASVSKKVASNVDFNLLYGRRDVDNMAQPNSAAPQDAIQVVRGELRIAF
jgi:hypothetical protein